MRKVDLDNQIFKIQKASKPAQSQNFKPRTTTFPLDQEWPGEAQAISTPGAVHKNKGAYLSELIMLNRFGELPPQFWNMSQYKGIYSYILKGINAILKRRPEYFKIMHKVIVTNNITATGTTFKNLIHDEFHGTQRERQTYEY